MNKLIFAFMIYDDMDIREDEEMDTSTDEESDEEDTEDDLFTGEDEEETL